LPLADRREALAAVLPPALRAAVADRPSRTKALFNEQGDYLGQADDWSPGSADPITVEMAGRVLADMERTILVPADPARLLARVFALFAHCPTKAPVSPEVEQIVAADWAEDLGEYPLWAIEQAARHWRRTSRFRPSIMEMRSLCEEACREERRVASRLKAIAASGEPEKRAPPIVPKLRRMA
jgi:hypothetical protein